VNSRGQSSKTVSHDISDFIARATLRNISPEVRETAKLHLLDGLATMLGGANEKSSYFCAAVFAGRN
jgi:2-methylcitrate dehydratase PrpD